MIGFLGNHRLRKAPAAATSDSARPAARRPFLSRLLRDKRAATLPMMAAAIIPMIGIIGGGVDMSRAYLVRARLQQACDAGALAARRVMVGSVLDDNARAQAQNFFNINLREGAYGAEDVTFAVSDVLESGGEGTGKVAGTATANVPTTLMRVFGKTEIEMSTNCEATLSIENTDIMFVLDLTGSMACLPSDSSSTCSTYAGSNVVLSGGIYRTTEKSGSRIAGLRTAVKNFFTTIDAAIPSSARLRIGFLPYSSGVHVGEVLQSAAPGSIRTGTYQYQSRVANMTSAYHYPTTTWTDWGNQQTYGSPTAISNGNCTNYGNNAAFTGFTPTAPAGSHTPPTATVVGGARPANVTGVAYRRVSATWSSGTKTCIRERRTATTTYETRYRFTNWTYQPSNYTITQFAAGNAVALTTPGSTTEVTTSGSYTGQQLASGAAGTVILGNGTTDSRAWDGCVEERLGGNADIDSLATTDALRWAPTWWDDVTWLRTSAASATTTSSGSSPYFPASPANYNVIYSCPKAATRLNVMTQAQVNAYVDGTDFVAHGSTYHDIGMIWGTRMMSDGGIFALDHGAAPNGRPVQRHIIFMTDGDMDPSLTAYSPYGIEQLDKRIVGGGTLTDANLTTLHNARFLAACQAAKDEDISVWVVAFGTSLTTQLTQCADSGQAFQATSTAQLQLMFQQIAQRIAELRLSQ